MTRLAEQPSRQNPGRLARWPLGLALVAWLAWLACWSAAAWARGGVLDRLAGTTLTVNDLGDAADAAPGNAVCDADPPNGTCTLRAAIQEANRLPGPDTVIVPAGTISLTLAGAGEDAGATGDLDVSDSVAIVGSGITTTVVSGNQLDTLLQIHAGAGVNIKQMALRNGRGVGVAGGILNQGSLRLADVAVSGNSAVAAGNGGGIDNLGALALDTSQVTGNTASGRGGGIHNTGTLTITGSTIGGNTAGGEGGGVAVVSGTATILASTLETNRSAARGGGLWNHGQVVLRNVTLSLNGSDLGGAGMSQGAGGGQAKLSNVSIANNISRAGAGGLDVEGTAVWLQNSLLGSNLADNGQGDFIAADCAGAVDSHGYNLIATSNGCGIIGTTTGNLLDIGPGIMALFNNGGPTRTHALQPGSPALEAGNPAPPGSGGDACEAMDQRGLDRPQVYRCDIGAFELAGAPITATPTRTGTPGATPIPSPTSTVTASPGVPSPTTEPTATATETETSAPSETPSATVRPSATTMDENTPSPPPAGQPTSTPTVSATRTITRTPSRSPTRTATAPARRRIYTPMVSKQHTLR